MIRAPDALERPAHYPIVRARRKGEVMFSSIVVGTDGSGTATQAVREAVDMAKAVGATLELVSAYAPVSEQRLRAERRDAPEDVQWAIHPRQEVELSLSGGAELARKAGVEGK